MGEKQGEIGKGRLVSDSIADTRSRLAPADPDRRRFVIAGLALAPVVFTLRGRSALAQYETNELGSQSSGGQSGAVLGSVEE